jgi:hypothetical protein
MSAGTFFTFQHRREQAVLGRKPDAVGRTAVNRRCWGEAQTLGNPASALSG